MKKIVLVLLCFAAFLNCRIIYASPNSISKIKEEKYNYNDLIEKLDYKVNALRSDLELEFFLGNIDFYKRKNISQKELEEREKIFVFGGVRADILDCIKDLNELMNKLNDEENNLLKF